MKIKKYITSYLADTAKVAQSIDDNEVEKAINILLEVRKNNGRLFILGVGGGAANAAHAVCDFRKIAGIEAYTPSDNASELTARINDDGWDTAFANWLRVSKVNAKDCILVFSVGGGSEEKNISVNLVRALKLAKEKKAAVIGVVGRDGGYTARVADACVIIPSVNLETVTPHTEEFQSVIWHLMVSHPALKVQEMKWESVT